MLQAGLSPREILVTATRNGAITMGREDDLGTLRPGWNASRIGSSGGQEN